MESKLLDDYCHPENCTYAVIARHPMTFKHGKATKVWEKYYGTWNRIHPSNAIFFRYDDLIDRGCTSKLADPKLVQKYNRNRKKKCPPERQQEIWTKWNYTCEV